MIDSVNAAILAIICQVGKVVRPNLSITITGAVKGKIVNIVHMGLSEDIMIKDIHQRGINAKMV